MTIRCLIFLILITFAGTACGPNQQILESANENRTPDSEIAAVNSNAAPIPAGFEQDLESMRTADFRFIVVFRRKDDGAMDAGDKDWISRNVGAQANRRKLSDGGKAIIIGSNFPFPPLPKESAGRFKMDNFSKSDSGPLFAVANANANANK